MWHERAFKNPVSGKDFAHLGRCHAYAFDRHLVGSRVDGKVYEMSLPVDNGNGGWNFVTDAGTLIHRVRIAPPISRENERDRYNRLTVDVEAGLGPQPSLPGGDPTILTLADVNGFIWDVTMRDDGVTFDFNPSIKSGKIYKITDPSKTTTWQLGIDALQRLITVPLTLDLSQPEELDLVSSSGLKQFIIQVTVGGMLQTVAQGNSARDPQMIVSWSDDGTRTWNVNPRILNCGQVGDFKRRAMTSRMGASRNRNYKIECSDPIPWRILNATLKGDQFQPEERYTKKVAKSL